MKQRETFYFTNEERAICQEMGLSRKALKKALTAFIYRAKTNKERAIKNTEYLIELAKTKWIYGEDED